MPDEASQVVENLATTETNGFIFPKELASAMGKRSGEAKRAKKLLRAKLLHEKTIEYQAQPFTNGQTVFQTVQTVEASEELTCARGQLEKCNEKLKTLLDSDDAEAIDIERLTRSVASLRDQVRILEGRPLPGNRRPGPERAPRGQSIQPLD